MHRRRLNSQTLVGIVTSVNGSSVSVRLVDLPSSLLLSDGESYRLGQIGSMYKVNVGLTDLVAICDGVQAGLPKAENVAPSEDFSDHILSLTLFGEIFQGRFNRGVGQYPTVGDEVHILDERALRAVFSIDQGSALTLGTLSASSSVPVSINLDKLISRHSAVFGATGSGKSNFVSLAIEKLTADGFPTARVLILDPHDEYGHLGVCYSTSPVGNKKQLDLPYWALGFDTLLEICEFVTKPENETAMREWIVTKKTAYALAQNFPVLQERITADSPIPFSIREMWLEFTDREVATYTTGNRSARCVPVQVGNPVTLTAPIYPPTSPGGAAPFAPNPRGIIKQLESLKSRVVDSRFDFLFSPKFDPICTPPEQIPVLNETVGGWIGGPDSIVSIDLSTVEAKLDGVVSGALISVIYELLFWGQTTPISGQAQPILIVVDEAHRLLPSGAETVFSSMVQRIAKEGRKYGVGLMLVTQRPSEVDETILSQLGTIVALRTTNGNDRSKITSVVPDEFGSLGSVLPALRNGEAFIVGESVPIPTRMRTDLALNKVKGGDPSVGASWAKPDWPSIDGYRSAYEKWLSRTI